MSMALITAIQLLEVFAAYLCVTILLPHFTFGKTLHLKNRFEKFLVYTVIGNFWIINLVYMLELMHISYPVTLITFTVVPAILLKVWLEKIPVVKIFSEWWDVLRKLTGGQLGLKAFRASRKPIRKAFRKKIAKHFFDVYVKEIVEVLMILMVLIALFWIYGVNVFEQFGYKASDMVVHNYWINSLNENDLFVTGIYPYGFHCAVYYLHSVFGFDTFVILRLMGFVQNVWLHMMMLCFLKLICKSKFMPYLGVFTYILANFFSTGTYWRFASSLPQEYSLMFILPTAYALMRYFREQRREERGNVGIHRKAFLMIFAAGFSLAFTVHFYSTIVVGFFCVGTAIGFIIWFVKKKYFTRIMLTGIVSVVIMLLPMVIAYIGGTPLQASLMWGASVISGPSEEEGEDEVAAYVNNEHEEAKREYVEKYGEIAGTIAYDSSAIQQEIDYYSVHLQDERLSYVPMLLPFALLVVGIVIYILKRKEEAMYAASLLSIANCTILMSILISAPRFNLPALMDQSRTAIFYAYILMVTMTVFLDGILYIVTITSKSKAVINVASLLCLSAVVIYTAFNGGIKNRLYVDGEELNEAIECITHIIKTDEKYQWTIVSANDERLMIYDNGFHTEIYDFLFFMENTGPNGVERIPTPTVYFFVEKKPAAFFVGEYAGERISEAWAKERIKPAVGIGCYSNDERMVLMSRLYYWCEAFRKLYPNETTVFMENDNFICYRVEQNPYRLFNFSIDYGYNMH